MGDKQNINVGVGVQNARKPTGFIILNIGLGSVNLGAREREALDV